MNDIDYPLDQTVIDSEVEKLSTRRKEAREVLRDALRNADGNYDIVVFRNAREFKRIINALEDLGIYWCEIDKAIYASRHEVEDIINSH